MDEKAEIIQIWDFLRLSSFLQTCLTRAAFLKKNNGIYIYSKIIILSYKSSTLAKMMDIMGDVSPFLELTIWCVALLVAICTVAGNFDKGFKTEAVFVQGLELF